MQDVKFRCINKVENTFPGTFGSYMQVKGLFGPNKSLCLLHSGLRVRQKVKKNIIRVKNKGLESNLKGITKNS